MYYYFNLICGIEPASPGFNSVRIAPQLGELKWVEGVMPHRLGEIKVSLKQYKNKQISGSITLPEGLTGIFVGNGKLMDLKSRETKL